MPDDRSRLARFQGELRSDIAMGDRMLRFASALQTRICREVEALDGVARFSDVAPTAGAGGLRVLEDGAVFARALVEVSAVPRGAGDVTATGLTVDLVAADPTSPSLRARLHHVAPAAPAAAGAGWFEGEVGISPAGENAAPFDAFWRTVASRHADLVDYDAMRAAFPVGAGFRFDALQDDDATGEKAFLFVRDAGRALLAGWGVAGRGQ